MSWTEWGIIGYCAAAYYTNYCMYMTYLSGHIGKPGMGAYLFAGAIWWIILPVAIYNTLRGK